MLAMKTIMIAAPLESVAKVREKLLMDLSGNTYSM